MPIPVSSTAKRSSNCSPPSTGWAFKPQSDGSVLGVLHRIAEQIDQYLPQFGGVDTGSTRETHRSLPASRSDRFSATRTRISSATSFTRAVTSHGAISTAVWPASILATSSTSLINASRCSPLRLMMSRSRRWVSESLRVAQKVRESQDRVQRSSQFVAHVRQERAFGAVGGLRLIARLHQFVRALIDQQLEVLPDIAAIPPASREACQ